MHDGFVPYGALGQIDHALCNAHHLRELKALIELDGEAWATPMRDMLIAANVACDKARDSGAKALAPDQVHALVDRRYWEAVREGLAFHRALPNLERSPQWRGAPQASAWLQPADPAAKPSRTTGSASLSTSTSRSPRMVLTRGNRQPGVAVMAGAVGGFSFHAATIRS